jgi:hypothetical protein
VFERCWQQRSRDLQNQSALSGGNAVPLKMRRLSRVCAVDVWYFSDVTGRWRMSAVEGRTEVRIAGSDFRF